MQLTTIKITPAARLCLRRVAARTEEKYYEVLDRLLTTEETYLRDMPDTESVAITTEAEAAAVAFVRYNGLTFPDPETEMTVRAAYAFGFLRGKELAK